MEYDELFTFTLRVLLCFMNFHRELMQISTINFNITWKDVGGKKESFNEIKESNLE